MCKPDGNTKDTLLFDDFVAFFVENIKPLAEHITLMGGETLIYPWIGEVIDLLSAQHEIAVTINTNATMLNKDLVAKLLRLHELNLEMLHRCGDSGDLFQDSRDGCVPSGRSQSSPVFLRE